MQKKCGAKITARVDILSIGRSSFRVPTWQCCYLLGGHWLGTMTSTVILVVLSDCLNANNTCWLHVEIDAYYFVLMNKLGDADNCDWWNLSNILYQHWQVAWTSTSLFFKSMEKVYDDILMNLLSPEKEPVENDQKGKLFWERVLAYLESIKCNHLKHL